MRHPNLLNVDNVTIGKVLNAKREELLFTTDCKQLYNKVKLIFEESQINTPKSRQILYKLSTAKSISSAIIYVQNILFKAANMGV